MNEIQQFYQTGYLYKTFKHEASLNKLNQICHELNNKKIRQGFSFEEKYPRSSDLRPNVYQYDDIFLDILFENEIPTLFQNIISQDLHLSHIQLRISYPGVSYMNWHRDTHWYYGKELVGLIPPSYKIIFYPTIENGPLPMLKVLPGSHNRIFRSELVDLLQGRLLKSETIYSSPNQFLFFNTSILHSVNPEQNQSGSVRLIYTFCRSFQLDYFPGKEELHQIYQSKLQRI